MQKCCANENYTEVSIRQIVIYCSCCFTTTICYSRDWHMVSFLYCS